MKAKKIKVVGINYSIIEVDEIAEEQGNSGDIQYQKARIRIKKDMAEDKKQQTLIHEILHACFYEAGIQEQEEEVIERVGVILHQVLVDNPNLLK